MLCRIEAVEAKISTQTTGGQTPWFLSLTEKKKQESTQLILEKALFLLNRQKKWFEDGLKMSHTTAVEPRFTDYMYSTVRILYYLVIIYIHVLWLSQLRRCTGVYGMIMTSNLVFCSRLRIIKYSAQTFRRHLLLSSGSWAVGVSKFMPGFARGSILHDEAT